MCPPENRQESASGGEVRVPSVWQPRAKVCLVSPGRTGERQNGPGARTGLGNGPEWMLVRPPGPGCPMGEPWPFAPSPPLVNAQAAAKSVVSRTVVGDWWPSFLTFEVTSGLCHRTVQTDSACVHPAAPLGDLSHGFSTFPKPENSHLCNPSHYRPLWILPIFDFRQYRNFWA